MEKNNRINFNISKIVILAMLVIALSSVVLGLVLQEHFTILQKSNAVCLECIGLG
jgi:hypothetical protein